MKQFQIKDIGEITIRKNRRSKRLRATAKSNGELNVTIPYYVSYKEALNFLISHKTKILKIKEKVKSRKIQYEKYTVGEFYKTKFQSFEIDQHSGLNFNLRLIRKNHYKLSIPHNENIESDEIQFYVRHIIREIYRKEAKTYLIPKTRLFAQKYDLNFNRISIKNAKTRWGSCSSKNNINLNLNLMRLSEELIDYVILHELAHLKHQNHSADFWKFLGTLIDNPKKHDDELKKHCLHQFAT